MNVMKKNRKLWIVFCCYILLLVGCGYQPTNNVQPQLQNQSFTQLNLIPDMPRSQPRVAPVKSPSMPLSAVPMKQKETTSPHEDAMLDFEVENQTGKTIYVVCFSYIKRHAFTRWRWDKSNVYKLDPRQSSMITIDYIEDPRDRGNVFGYLAIFDSHKAAEDAVYELLPDSIQIDLDQLQKLKGQKVVLEVEKYGAKGELYEYDFVKKNATEQHKLISQYAETLDFPVENQTGKTIYVVCFTYQKKAKGTWIGAVGEKDDMALWHYNKEPIIKLMPGQIGMIHVTHVIEGRDQIYVQGHLGIFDETEELLAQDSTYERLSRQRHLALGRLFDLQGSKIVLEVEKYGAANTFIDYRIKPTRTIDFTKLRGPRSAIFTETKKQ